MSYICSSASEYFEKPVDVNDVVWSYSGVRPLYDDGATEAQEATRDYVLRADGDELPVINVFGGKITTYRKLSESMMEKIEALIGVRSASWTASSHLPGGDFEVADYDLLVSKLEQEFEFLDSLLAKRLIRSYGTNAWTLMKGALNIEDMGQDFGGTLSAREIEYLMKHEWAECAEDVVWRRTKLGIRLDENLIAVIDEWMQQKATFDQHSGKLRSQNC
jgi:glycerol-3-phosphate dehydrogenase